jgi:hypothetical protein
VLDFGHMIANITRRSLLEDLLSGSSTNASWLQGNGEHALSAIAAQRHLTTMPSLSTPSCSSTYAAHQTGQPEGRGVGGSAAQQHGKSPTMARFVEKRRQLQEHIALGPQQLRHRKGCFRKVRAQMRFMIAQVQRVWRHCT